MLGPRLLHTFDISIPSTQQHSFPGEQTSLALLASLSFLPSFLVSPSLFEYEIIACPSAGRSTLWSLNVHTVFDVHNIGRVPQSEWRELTNERPATLLANLTLLNLGCRNATCQAPCLPGTLHQALME
jgi:hypothetical protein